jgi:nicotinate-nucleotide adenylyltransferase
MMKAYAPKIALFGGAFDPVHRGHESVIEFLKNELHFTSVWLIPSGDSVFKRPQAAAHHRLKCLEILTKGMTDVRIETHEINSIGPHFTSQTLDHLALPRDDVTFVIGTDQFIQLEKWKKFPEVLGQCHWLVLLRAGIQNEAVEQQKNRLKALGVLKPLGTGFNGAPSFTPNAFSTPTGTFLHLHPVNAPELSSRQIRKELAIFGQLTDTSLLHPGVDTYLKEHELYGRVP